MTNINSPAAFDVVDHAVVSPRAARRELQTQVVARPPPAVTAVILSRDRPLELARTLSAVLAQQMRACLDVVVVDSSQEFNAISRITGCHANVSVVRSTVNLGGAGGFALGILTAMAGGAEWLWLMDDDGRPHDEAVLAELLRTAALRGLYAVSPAVLAADNVARFAFPYAVDGRYVFRRDEIPADAFLSSTAHLFNGLLIKASSFFTVGLPDLRMFARGDEVDFMHRMRRAGLRFGTTAAAAFLHPSSDNEIHPIWGGRLHVVIPETSWKRRCQFRNRSFNHARHRLWCILIVDAVRYPYFFLISRRGDVAGLKEWLSCTMAGLRGRVGVHAQPDAAATPLDRPS